MLVVVPKQGMDGWGVTSANSYLGAVLSLSGLLLAHTLRLVGLLCGGVLGFVKGRHAYDLKERTRPCYSAKIRQTCNFLEPRNSRQDLDYLKIRLNCERWAEIGL